MPKLADFLTDEERREIEARRDEMPTGPVDDPDNPEWTDEDFARAKRVEDLDPELRDAILASFPKTAKRLGRPKAASPKVEVKIRLDAGVVAHLRESGPGWQTRVNAALNALVSEGRL